MRFFLLFAVLLTSGTALAQGVPRPSTGGGGPGGTPGTIEALYGSQTIDFGAITADTALEGAIPVTGAQVGDVVACTVPDIFGMPLALRCFVTGANSVTVHMVVEADAYISFDPPPALVTATVFHYTAP